MVLPELVIDGNLFVLFTVIQGKHLPLELSPAAVLKLDKKSHSL
jgi:hypothetical protein